MIGLREVHGIGDHCAVKNLYPLLIQCMKALFSKFNSQTFRIYAMVIGNFRSFCFITNSTF